MEKVKVVIFNKQKSVKIPSGLRLLVRRCCTAVLRVEKFPYPAEVSVTFVDDDQIKYYNREYRNIDRSTDVLSFPMGENGNYDENPETGYKILGDVMISIPKAQEQAYAYMHSLEREVAYLTAHSMLHLLGYDHENTAPEKVRIMREKEEYVMTLLGVPSPDNS